MRAWDKLQALTRDQRNAVLASFLGWTLDAFDFFLLVFVVRDIAATFASSVETVTVAILLTLAMRPLGAFLFGLAADRFGRRPVLMIDILLYSLFEFASAFAPSLPVLIVLRALYGIAMGGEWGVGASLALETIPAESRGIVSGLLQEGYATGYLLAALAFFFLYPSIGWRGMFVVGVGPALVVLFIRRAVKESPAWQIVSAQRIGFFTALRGRWGLFVYVVALMTAFNFLSHGTQDLYPTFLEVQRHLSPHTVGIIAVIYNIGALIGGVFFGALSDRIGRRNAIVLAALLALPVLPLWAFAGAPLLLGLGAFLMQFMVQGAWGIVPAHLNELSPSDVRGTFPGFTYQLGNLLASANATLQADLAARYGGDYGLALALVAGVVALAVAALAWLGRERKGVAFAGAGRAE